MTIASLKIFVSRTGAFVTTGNTTFAIQGHQTVNRKPEPVKLLINAGQVRRLGFLGELALLQPGDVLEVEATIETISGGLLDAENVTDIRVTPPAVRHGRC